MSVYTSFSTKKTSQREPSPFEKEVKNNAGGFVFELDLFKQLERFLILGTSGGTFYVGERKLTKDAAIAAIKAIQLDGQKAVKLIVDISESGRAPKNDPALFALALAASAPEISTRRAALAALPKVARIPTHLFHFVTYIEQFRGWGRSLKRAIGEWYQVQDVERLAYQMVKYQSRDGWSNRDLLRLSHPKTSDAKRNALYKWAVDGFDKAVEMAQAQGAKDGVAVGTRLLPNILPAFEEAKKANTKGLIDLIQTYNLSREMLPTEALTQPEVWEAMLPKMGLEALLRNLGNMTRIGLIKPLTKATAIVVERLTNEEELKRSRLHPYAILVAMKVYASGGGFLSDKTWTAVPQILAALNEAFYKSFVNVESTGKNFLIGLDVSGSMSSSMIGGRTDARGRMVPGIISAAEGAAAMAMTVARTEKNSHIFGFTAGRRLNERSNGWSNTSLGGYHQMLYNADARLKGFVELGINPTMDLIQVVQTVRDQTMGPTDCALPMIYALQNKMDVDCFIVLTDNETWAGDIKPAQALRMYREKMNKPNAKLIVVGMTATQFSIADPKDPNSLDVVGFDASVPEVIRSFVL